MPGRALAPEDLHPRQYGGGNLEMVYSFSFVFGFSIVNHMIFLVQFEINKHE